MFSDIRFPEGEINEDTCVVVRLLMQSRKVVFLDRELYFYRKRTGSITRSGYSQAFQIVTCHLSQIASWIMKDHPDLEPYMKNFAGFIIISFSFQSCVSRTENGTKKTTAYILKSFQTVSTHL